MEENKQPDSASGFRLQNLMDNLSDSIYFKDCQSRFVMVNQTCFVKHGWESADAVKGKTDFDVFSKEHAEQAFADEQKIIETGEPLDNIEEKETWPDGSVTWVSTTKMPLKSADGKIIGTFGMSRDITERKEAELRVQRYAEEIRLIKEEMEEDVRMASELQKTFSPNRYPIYPLGSSPEEQCVEFLHQLKSYSDISGDYCSIQRLSDTVVGIFLCDVQGIGVRAALGTALIRGIVQEISSLEMDPGAYLSRASQLLTPLLHQEGIPLEVKACYLVLDLMTGQIRMANAGSLTPVLIGQDAEVQWLVEDEGSPNPALAMESSQTYETIECMIHPGDRVVLFTDGFCGITNKSGQFYGGERLLASVAKHAGEPLSTLFQSLEEDACSFSSTGTLSDDVCLVGLQFNRFLR
jgi:sigma-B regulation protein RsbU (phosphoserine phosphatase)